MLKKEKLGMGKRVEFKHTLYNTNFSKKKVSKSLLFLNFRVYYFQISIHLLSILVI